MENKYFEKLLSYEESNIKDPTLSASDYSRYDAYKYYLNTSYDISPTRLVEMASDVIDYINNDREYSSTDTQKFIVGIVYLSRSNNNLSGVRVLTNPDDPNKVTLHYGLSEITTDNILRDTSFQYILRQLALAGLVMKEDYFTRYLGAAISTMRSYKRYSDTDKNEDIPVVIR